MLKRIARAAALAAALVWPLQAVADNLPTYKDSAGFTRDAIGVVAVNPSTGNSVGAGLSESDFDSKTGSLTETAPATDTASSGLNGRLQRIAQRITSFIALLPASLGQKAMSASLAVAIASDQSAVAVTPAATENHIGEVGNNQKAISVAQTVTASSAYSIGNAVGGWITFANAARVSAGSGLIQSVVVASKSAQTTQMDLLIFNSDVTGTSTCTDKNAVAIATTDMANAIGVAHITDWTSGGTPSVGQAQNLAMPFALASGTSLYGCLVTRATPTFAATTDITIVLRDIRN